MPDMKFKKILQNFRIPESLKEMELNLILDKITKRVRLNGKEKSFLETYKDINDDDLKSFAMLSRLTTVEKINSLIDSKKKIICDLKDRDGKLGLQIVKIENLDEDEVSIINLKNGSTFKMKDNFLYNIIYNLKKDIYSLEASDEFYEKLKV
jgi:hypothetical protein